MEIDIIIKSIFVPESRLPLGRNLQRQTEDTVSHLKRGCADGPQEYADEMYVT